MTPAKQDGRRAIQAKDRRQTVERRVSKAVFKAKACELFRQVETLGESLIVTDHGQPTIEIRRYAGRRKQPIAALREAIIHFNPESR
jgi:hypothetical protein